MTRMQTVKWWGPSWGAPICDPDHHVEVPVGERCNRCGTEFLYLAQGISLPYADPGISVLGGWLHWDLDCWLQEIGIAKPNQPEPVFTIPICAACSDRIDWRPGEQVCQPSVRLASSLLERCRTCLGNFEDRLGVLRVQLRRTERPGDHQHASDQAFDRIGGPEQAHRCACGAWGLSDREGGGIRWLPS